jgi:hypothetical protein
MGVVRKREVVLDYAIVELRQRLNTGTGTDPRRVGKDLGFRHLLGGSITPRRQQPLDQLAGDVGRNRRGFVVGPV